MSTVNEKMTAIADGIRNLSGTTSSLTLDDMATKLNSTSSALHEINLELTNLVDLMINSGIGETLNGTDPSYPVIEQIQDLAGDLSSNLDQIFHFFNANTTTIKNNTAYPALVYFNNPTDFSFTSITIPPRSAQEINLIQTCVCFIVLPSYQIDILFRGSDNIELIVNEVLSDFLHRYMIFRGINTTPKVEATINIIQIGAEEPS